MRGNPIFAPEATSTGPPVRRTGGTASKASWRALPDCWPLMTGRPAAALHKAAGCSHGTEVVAGDAARILMASERGCTEAEELGPQFLCPVQGWQRAGTVPATAARPSPAAASHRRMLALT